MTGLHFTKIGAQTIAYTDQGTGPCVVLAHDLGLDHSVWGPVMAHLPGLRIVRYDLRGHGASAAPPPPYPMGALIRDLEGLIDHLSIRDCVLVGSGLGGMVAQGLAVKRLDQIRALVLANTATKLGTKDIWAARIGAARKAGHDPQLKQALGTGGRDISLPPSNLDGMMGCMAAIAGADFYTTTASLRLPTLVIASGQDRISPADMAMELATLIPGARTHLIRTAGHWPMIDTPKAFADALKTFLADIGHL
jgi:3-oxoadipate enol-lactonase